MSRADGVLCKVPQAASSLGLYADSPPHHLFHLVAFLFSYTPDQLKLSPTGHCHCQFYLQRRPPFILGGGGSSSSSSTRANVKQQLAWLTTPTFAISTHLFSQAAWLFMSGVIIIELGC